MTSPQESPLEVALTCPMCQELLQDPHLLPCGHSLCLACVQDLWAKAPSDRLQCPECQEEHGPAATLRKNSTLDSLAREMRRRSGTQVPCDACLPEDLTGSAVKTCLRCELSLCAEHLQPHLERPAFVSHLLVEPLDDLDKRRCPEHGEMFRYYCLDEHVYVCADCVLDGKHGGHQVKTLKSMEMDLKAVLRSRLETAERKLGVSERLLKEHKTEGHFLMDSSWADAQVDRLGDSLQAQVERLVGALRESAQLERQQIQARWQQDHSRVVRELHQTRSIQQYLEALLEEKDPFLLIWAYQSEDKKVAAELNSPLFSPTPIVSLDKKRMMEDIDTKCRRFVAEALECVEELRRDFSNGELSLDVNTAHPLLRVSSDLRSVVRVKDCLPYLPHPDRYDHWTQVLTSQSFSSGRHFWEIEARGYWDIAVCYQSVGRKGKDGTAFGSNRQSWSLMQQDDGTLSVWHDKVRTPLNTRLRGTRVGLSLDCSAGTITFSEADTVPQHLHTFHTTFTEPVHLGFGLYKAEQQSRVHIAKK